MPNPADRPVHKVFTTRAGGVSRPPFRGFNLAQHVGDDPAAVEKNRARLAHALGLEPESFVWMEQLHTNTVTVVDDATGTGEPVEATDSLVTTTRGLALGVLVADCVPVLLSDHDAGVIAAVHAGRLGARNGIVAKTIKVMVDLGATPANIHALLGPSAAGANYEVPAAMAEDVEKHLPGSQCRTAQGTTGLELRSGLERQLNELGVKAVDIDPRDTISDKDFFSHRREGNTGRQAGVIWLPAHAKEGTGGR